MGNGNYMEMTVLLVRRCLRRMELRSEPCPLRTEAFSVDERKEERKTKEELKRIDTEVSSLLTKIRNQEKQHEELGIHSIVRQMGRELTDVETCILWTLFWASFIDHIYTEGRMILLACSNGNIDELVQNRLLLQSDSALRSIGVVTVASGRHRTRVNLLEQNFALSESIIRTLSHNEQANIATFECMRLDHGTD